MKKYLGSMMTAYAAIISPCFIVGPVVFGVFILTAEISVATAFLFVMCLSCSILWSYYLWKEKNQLYSWGTFKETAVYVSVPFQKPFAIEYDKCKSCGIGMYRHAFMNSQNSLLGSNVYFIFMSVDYFPEKYRTQINLWKPSQKQIKVQFSKKLYSYLLTVLPRKQAMMLKGDYERTLGRK